MVLFPTQEHKKITAQAIAHLNAAYPNPTYAKVTAGLHTNSSIKPGAQEVNALHPKEKLNFIEEPATEKFKRAQSNIQGILSNTTAPPKAPSNINSLEEGWITVQRKKSNKDKQSPSLGKYNHPLLLKKLQGLREQGKCFKCTEKGHLQFACRNSMRCFKCNGFGHKSGICKFKQEKPIKAPIVPYTVPQKPENKEQHFQANSNKEEMENWQTMPMLPPSRLPTVRHELRRAYVPVREGLHPTNELLERAAVVHMWPNCNEQTLPHRLATTLAAQLHRHPRDFKIGKLDRSIGHFLVAFPTVVLRNHAMHVGVFAIDHNAHVQLAEWKPSLGMTYDPIAYKARLILRGLPLNAWNIIDLDHFLAGIGHVLKKAPVFVNENFDTLRVLISCHNPASIPPTLLYTGNPYSTTVFIEVEGWLHFPIGPLPPPGGDESRLQRNNGRRAPPSLERSSPDSGDYSRSIDTYHEGADSTYSRRTRPALETPVQTNPIPIQILKPQLEAIETNKTGEQRNKGKMEGATLVPRGKKTYPKFTKVVSTIYFKRTWDAVSMHAQYTTRGKSDTAVWQITLEAPPHPLFSNTWANISDFSFGPVNIGFQKNSSILGPNEKSSFRLEPKKTIGPGPTTDEIIHGADFLAFLHEDGPLPQIELNKTPEDPFAFLFTDGPPPGFEKETKFKNNIRRSP